MTERNEVRITARLVGRTPLRFTPAGVPVATADLEHRSVVVEGDRERTLAFEMEAVAVGGVANALVAEALGTEVEITGFLAPRSKRSKRLVLHIVGMVCSSGEKSAE
ncbi:MAG TPA: primosomal replication protein N [Burkholderiaceae bacterium]|nr:primosomal replication protein N [Burkholderiaceae bacterium]